MSTLELTQLEKLENNILFIAKEYNINGVEQHLFNILKKNGFNQIKKNEEDFAQYYAELNATYFQDLHKKFEELYKTSNIKPFGEIYSIDYNNKIAEIRDHKNSVILLLNQIDILNKNQSND
jgi:hypothetical protein